MEHNTQHRWKFFRAGRLDQVRFCSGEDIANLEFLDQKLWVALSCPVRGIEFDAKTLDLIDKDRDGRIRAMELIEAVRWALQRLKNPDDLLKVGDALPLAAINDQNEAGSKLLSGARRILANLGKPDATTITIADTTDTRNIFAQTKLNGDGIVPANSASDAETQKVIEEIIACLGAETDRSGKPGVNKAKLDLFLQQAQAFSDWAAQAESSSAISPFEAETAAAAAAVRTVKTKIDDYFARCRLAAFDSRAIGPLNRAESEFILLAAKDLSLTSEEIAKLPLARIAAGKPLPLADELNPAWMAAMADFRKKAVAAVFGAELPSLSEEQWREVAARFSAFEAWNAAKPATVVEKLGLPRIRAILSSPAKETIARLIEQDLALEPENAQINAVDQLIRYYRDLNRLLHNYVNLSDFYDPRYPATFQVGRLYLDGRACDLCFHVEDIAKHSTLAASGKIYLAYCDAVRPSTGQKRTICAAFTSGFAESLWVGRNGVFYDRQGNDWDAVIVKVVEHPISLKEAFWSPWKKIAAMIGDQVKKLLSAREAAALSAASKSVEQIGNVPASPVPGPAPAPASAPARMEGAAVASSVAAIGIAVGLLGNGAAKVFSVLHDQGLDLWQIVLGVAAVILAVSGPSVILAYFKLRARDLTPVLNACGWAINSRIRMTLRLGRELTQEAKLPSGSERSLADPYAEVNWRRNLLVALLVLGALAYTVWRFDLWQKVASKSSPTKPQVEQSTNNPPKPQ